ncbi:MAG TPA: hypothetical protein VN946_25805 [Terriglobales bacterium]|nr:hypothetical protein [Terriglobales bacterium]
MKLKLALMTLIALGCSAAFAQGSATLGFASPGDVGLDCDYEQIQWGGSNNFIRPGHRQLDCLRRDNQPLRHNGWHESFHHAR